MSFKLEALREQIRKTREENPDPDRERVLALLPKSKYQEIKWRPLKRNGE